MDRQEAIKVVRDNWPEGRVLLKSALEILIPELKESEDGQHRKWILEYLYDGLRKSDEQFKDEFKCAIAWLEKQGVVPSVSEQIKSTEDCDSTGCNSTIEKGKWYVCIKPRYTNFIVGKAYLSPKDGMLSSGTMSQYVAKHCFHLWTIQDAKDGDVLSYNDGHGNDCIELIKSITDLNKDKKIEFWFCLTNNEIYEVFDGICPYTNMTSRQNATPATKEQRNLLFSKMKEAGYEWDAEKKELKQIEQKPALA